MSAQRHHRIALILALAASLAGCSDRKPPAAPTPAAKPFTPVEHEPTMEEKAQQQDKVEAALASGTTPTTYVASFETGKLQSIAETRTVPATAVRRGNYVFYGGARLTEYSGAALLSDATVDLRFDLQGAVTSASGSAGKPSDDEISAIRNRAQLLRSHALARKSTRDHSGTSYR